MSKISNTIASLLAGVVVGAAVGYVLATDKEKRQEDIEKLKKGLNSLKERVGKKGADLEEEIYHT